MSAALSPLDATFLELEQVDEAVNMNIGAVLVFDASPGGGAPSLRDVRAHLARRLERLPRFRQRLSTPRTGGLSWPRWREDAGFDVADHVRRAALPPPGGEEELRDWAADHWSHRCDRGRPLWEIVLLEGLAGGRWALVTKTHHAMLDGVGSVDVGHLLLDAEPEPGPDPEPPAPAATPAEPDGGIAAWPLAAARAATWPARASVDLALHPSRLGSALDRSRALVETLARDELVPAAGSSLNVPIGSSRRYAVVRAPLADLKLVARRLGGTVNDAVLAAAAGGLRAVLLDRGEPLPARGLRAMVPVNLRTASEQLALGNRVTSLFVHLPVAEPTSVERHALTVEDAEAHKAGSEALGTATIVDLTSLAPPVLHAILARSLYATRLFNLTITNVPGPQATLYAFGAPLREVWPLVPLAADHAVGIAVVSYDGGVVFGLSADRAAMPDLDRLGDGIAASLDELVREARARGRRPARRG